MDQQPLEIVDLEDVQGTEDAFAAWGFVVLKVQRGERAAGIRVKIASVPQEDFDALRKQAPRPPAKMEMLDPTKPEHAALGVTTRQKGFLPDFTDPTYLQQQETYDLKFRREIVGKGVKSKIKLKDGRMPTTPEEQYQALEEQGISGVHFAEIVKEIVNLTTWTEEERERFLTKPSASTPAR